METKKSTRTEIEIPAFVLEAQRARRLAREAELRRECQVIVPVERYRLNWQDVKEALAMLAGAIVGAAGFWAFCTATIILFG